MIGGAVPAYMALMWAPPLTWVLACFRGPAGSEQSRPVPPATNLELLMAALAALSLFGAAELVLSAPEGAFPLRLWAAENVQRRCFGHVACYVLPAEAALGAAALMDYRGTRSDAFGHVQRVLMALAVAIFYAGALSVSYLLIEAA